MKWLRIGISQAVTDCVSWMPGWLAKCLGECLSGYLGGCLTECLARCLGGYLAGCLSGCFGGFLMDVFDFIWQRKTFSKIQSIEKSSTHEQQCTTTPLTWNTTPMRRWLERVLGNAPMSSLMCLRVKRIQTGYDTTKIYCSTCGDVSLYRVNERIDGTMKIDYFQQP